MGQAVAQMGEVMLTKILLCVILVLYAVGALHTGVCLKCSHDRTLARGIRPPSAWIRLSVACVAVLVWPAFLLLASMMKDRR